MRRIVLQMMITVDGFVAGPNGELDWIDNDPEMGKAHAKLAREADAALMGHHLYADMAGFWPMTAESTEVAPEEVAFAKLMNDMRKFVILTEPEDLQWSNAEQVLVQDEDDLVRKVQDLKDQDGNYLLFYGGAQTAQTLLRHGLVDELRLDVCPVALGQGRPMFAERADLELVDSTAYASGAMGMTYKPKTVSAEPQAQPRQQAVLMDIPVKSDDTVEFGSWAKILIVEDNVAIAELYKQRMEMIGYICFVAHEGNEALTMIERERPSLVLLDLMVPGVAGDQILRRMRASKWGQDIKVLVISNLNEEDAPAGLRSQGIEGYAVKANLTDDQLDQMVNKIFERTGERPQV